MTQTLLFPDPRPLVERLGAEFFRRAPECPGVYLMRDAADAVLYVGKARNLRRRLGSYRVANPDRMPRRHLRLLRAVARIELEECADEPAALTRESELLRSLRPRFNRAGTWPGTPRFLLWRTAPEQVELAVALSIDPAWRNVGPLGAGADVVRAALVRLVWSAIHVELEFAAMPVSWFRGRHSGVTTLPVSHAAPGGFDSLNEKLEALFCGDAQPFAGWILERTCTRSHPFELAARDADLETLLQFAAKARNGGTPISNAGTEPRKEAGTPRDGEPTADLFSAS